MRGCAFKLATVMAAVLATCVNALAQSPSPACQQLEAQLA
jgi:hypothetical protein